MSDYIGYGELIEQSMLDVVKKCLKTVEKEGLPGEHHFYITFLTDFAGVEIDADLKKEHPYDMTIVLQNQFWNLAVDDDKFSLELSFNNKQKKLVIPFDALLSFNDPSVQFSLHFNMSMYGEEDVITEMKEVEKTETKKQETEVIDLSKFRKEKEDSKNDK
ncbi:MAG: ClpXP protease specificity-enhancing factor SspB [Alphaproteobacteria bacterium]